MVFLLCLYFSCHVAVPLSPCILIILSEEKNLSFQNEDNARRDSTFLVLQKGFYLENFQRATHFCGTYTGY